MTIAFAFNDPLLEKIGGLSLEALSLWSAWLEEWAPEKREDLRFGQLTAVVANVHGNNTSPEDFMLFSKEEPPGTEEQYFAVMAGYFQAHGLAIIDPNEKVKK